MARFRNGSSWVLLLGGPRKEDPDHVADQALVEMRTPVRRLTRRTAGEASNKSSKPQPLSTRLEGILPAGGHAAGLQRSGRCFAIVSERSNCRSGNQAGLPSGSWSLRGFTDLAAAVAANTRRWWKSSAIAIHVALPNPLVRPPTPAAGRVTTTSRTAGCGPRMSGSMGRGAAVTRRPLSRSGHVGGGDHLRAIQPTGQEGKGWAGCRLGRGRPAGNRV